MKKVDAVVLIAGLGERLRPLTLLTPKPLLPINNELVLTKILEKILKIEFIEKIFLISAYLKEITYQYFKYLRRIYNKIQLVLDDKLRGTAGQLLSVKKFLNNDVVIVINGDVLSNYEKIITEGIDYHDKVQADLTIISREIEISLRFGILQCSNGKVNKWIEKPKVKHRVSMGIYIINKYLLDTLEDKKFIDMNEWVNSLIQKNYNVYTYCLNDVEFIDIGTLSDYLSVFKK